MLASLTVLLSGAVLHALASHHFDRREQAAVLASFAAHALGSVLQVWMVLYYYGGGDLQLYYRTGMAIADCLHRDYQLFAPEVLHLLHQETSRFPFMIHGAGSPTGSLTAMTGISIYVIGPSLYANCLAFALFSSLGKVAFYRGLRLRRGENRRPALLFACLLVPSYVFWTAAIVKEAVAVGGFGLTVYGLSRLAAGKRWGILAVLAGSYPMFLTKPYILVAAVGIAPVWLFAASLQRRRGHVPVRHIVTAAFLTLLAVLLAGQVFPRFSLENVGDSFAHLQSVGTRVTGGSSYTLADGAVPQSLAGQLALAPLALASSLFRPLPFETGSALAAINSLETLTFTVMFVSVLYRLGPGKMVRTVVGDAELLAAATFVLIFGTAVGLATTNLGTLSRYRAPLMPFWVFLLLELRFRSRRSDPRAAAAKRSFVGEGFRPRGRV